MMAYMLSSNLLRALLPVGVSNGITTVSLYAARATVHLLLLTVHNLVDMKCITLC
jgi:uncharacterized protein (DUF2062 family)